MFFAEFIEDVNTSWWTLAFLLPLRSNPALMFHLTQRSIDQARIKSFKVEAKVFQFRE
jgi:hypothetical protein